MKVSKKGKGKLLQVRQGKFFCILPRAFVVDKSAELNTHRCVIDLEMPNVDHAAMAEKRQELRADCGSWSVGNLLCQTAT